MNTLVKKFKSKFSDAETKVLRICQETGKVEKLEAILVRNTNINLNEIRYEGWSLLHLACINVFIELIEYLISRTQIDLLAVREISSVATKSTVVADPMLLCPGCSVLHMVCFLGSAQLVQLLVEKGVSLSAVTKNGYNCMHYASYSGYEGLVKYLASMHVEAGLRSQEGHTPLIIACRNNKLGVVMCLLETASVDVDDAAPDGLTALHFSSACGYVAIVEYLLNAGADPKRTDTVGRSPLDLTKNSAIRELLKMRMQTFQKSAKVDNESPAVSIKTVAPYSNGKGGDAPKSEPSPKGLSTIRESEELEDGVYTNRKLNGNGNAIIMPIVPSKERPGGGIRPQLSYMSSLTSDTNNSDADEPASPVTIPEKDASAQMTKLAIGLLTRASSSTDDVAVSMEPIPSPPSLPEASSEPVLSASAPMLPPVPPVQSEAVPSPVSVLIPTPAIEPVPEAQTLESSAAVAPVSTSVETEGTSVNSSVTTIPSPIPNEEKVELEAMSSSAASLDSSKPTLVDMAEFVQKAPTPTAAPEDVSESTSATVSVTQKPSRPSLNQFAPSNNEAQPTASAPTAQTVAMPVLPVEGKVSLSAPSAAPIVAKEADTKVADSMSVATTAKPPSRPTSATAARPRANTHDTDDPEKVAAPPPGAVALCWRICKETGDVPELMKLLQQYPALDGCLVTLRDWDKWTPLLRAANGGHVNLVRYLIGRGANVADTDRGGHMPLHRACWRGHLPVVKYLLEHADAEIEGLDNTLGTALHKAAANGQEEVSRYLISKGANIDAKNMDGFTPLHLACQQGHEGVVRMLVKEAGCDLAIQTKFGETVFELAGTDGIRALLESGTGVDTGGGVGVGGGAAEGTVTNGVQPQPTATDPASSETQVDDSEGDVPAVEPVDEADEDENGFMDSSSEESDDITITSSVSAGPILMRDFEADLTKWKAFAEARIPVVRPASTPPPYTESWTDRGVRIPSAVGTTPAQIRQPVRVRSDVAHDEPEQEEEEDGGSNSNSLPSEDLRRKYFTTPSVTAAQGSDVATSFDADGSLRITRVIPPLKSGHMDSRGNAFAGSEAALFAAASEVLPATLPAGNEAVVPLQTPPVAPEAAARVRPEAVAEKRAPNDAVGFVAVEPAGVTGKGGIGQVSRIPRPTASRATTLEDTSKWMGLVGAVCRAVGRQGFRAMSRRFDQWKYSDVGGVEAIGGGAPMASMMMDSNPVDISADNDEIDDDDDDLDAYEIQEEEEDQTPKIPNITAAQAKELLRGMGRLPKVIRPLLRLNESVLWAIFTHYCGRKQEIPANTVQESRRHRRKLLTSEEVWVLLRDFGVCPELCGRGKLKELLMDLGYLSSDKSKGKAGKLQAGGVSATKSRTGAAAPKSGSGSSNASATPKDLMDKFLQASSSATGRGVKSHYAMPLNRSSAVPEKDRRTFSTSSVVPSNAANAPILSFMGFLKLLWKITVECLEAPPPAGAPFRLCMLLRRMDSSDGRHKMTQHSRDFRILPAFKIPTDASALAMALTLSQLMESTSAPATDQATTDTHPDPKAAEAASKSGPQSRGPSPARLRSPETCASPARPPTATASASASAVRKSRPPSGGPTQMRGSTAGRQSLVPDSKQTLSGLSGRATVGGTGGAPNGLSSSKEGQPLSRDGRPRRVSKAPPSAAPAPVPAKTVQGGGRKTRQ